MSKYTYQVIIRGMSATGPQEWACCLEDEVVTMSAALSTLMLRATAAGITRIKQIKIVRR